MDAKPTFFDAFADKAFLITLVISFQFFAMILIFSFWPSRMDPQGKNTILIAYITAFGAGWGYFLGSSAGSKDKDKVLADKVEKG